MKQSVHKIYVSGMDKMFYPWLQHVQGDKDSTKLHSPSWRYQGINIEESAGIHEWQWACYYIHNIVHGET